MGVVSSKKRQLFQGIFKNLKDSSFAARWRESASSELSTKASSVEFKPHCPNRKWHPFLYRKWLYSLCLKQLHRHKHLQDTLCFLACATTAETVVNRGWELGDGSRSPQNANHCNGLESDSISTSIGLKWSTWIWPPLARHTLNTANKRTTDCPEWQSTTLIQSPEMKPVSSDCGFLSKRAQIVFSRQ